jgi:hypothetical protein
VSQVDEGHAEEGNEPSGLSTVGLGFDDVEETRVVNIGLGFKWELPSSEQRAMVG